MNTPNAPLAIYVHWPWCKAKCPYCDFNSHAGEVQEEAYIAGLLNELGMWENGFGLAGTTIAPLRGQKRPLTSIFFGGGTPSLMKPQSIGRIIEKCADLGAFDRDTEVTVECNPTSFDDLHLAQRFFRDLREVGVNRISIGIQGLQQDWLRFLGREHDVAGAIGTLDAAQAIFDNVNADVIYGLPNQNLEDWTSLLETLCVRGLRHISAYQLTIEKNTRFYADVRRGAWAPIDSDLEADFFEATRAVLGAHGYENYEISNFAKPGRACRHNVHIWNYGEYLGIGAGAHGRMITTDGTRIATHVIRQPEGYLRRMKDLSTASDDGAIRGTPLNSAENVQEAIFSGLRLKTGCDINHLLKTHGEAVYKEAISERETALLTSAGLLERTPSHLRLSDSGWPLLNSVLSRLLTPLSTPGNLSAPSDTPSTNAYKSSTTVLIS